MDADRLADLDEGGSSVGNDTYDMGGSEVCDENLVLVVMGRLDISFADEDNYIYKGDQGVGTEVDGGKG